jgi:hypothetical protein
MTIYNSPIAVEMIVAVIKAAAAIMMPIRNAEHAIYGTHRTANAGTDRAADYTTYRAGNPIAFRGTLPRTAHKALCVPDMGDCDQSKRQRRSGKIKFGGRSGRQCRGLDFRLHLNASGSAATDRRVGYM